MPSQRTSATAKPWTKIEAESLVAWMEENQEVLRGKQVDWHKKVNQEVFPNDEHITVKKSLTRPIKISWKAAREMAERSGWGIKPEDDETSINETLERKCTFFWRLEAIWGTRPNIRIYADIESIQVSTEPSQAQVFESEPPLQASNPPPSRSQSAVVTESVDLESASESESKPASESKRRKLHSKKHDLTMLMKDVLLNKQAVEEKLAQEKLKAKTETAREQLKAEIEAKIEIARIQVEGQVNQMRIFDDMMKDMLAASRGTGSGGGLPVGLTVCLAGGLLVGLAGGLAGGLAVAVYLAS